jgi:hypothetical protein
LNRPGTIVHIFIHVASLYQDRPPKPNAAENKDMVVTIGPINGILPTVKGVMLGLRKSTTAPTISAIETRKLRMKKPITSKRRTTTNNEILNNLLINPSSLVAEETTAGATAAAIGPTILNHLISFSY